MTQPSTPRGFSLVELMVASAIVLIIFAGASWAAVQLHKRGNFEEAVADLQDVARGSRELIAPRIERAGSGISNLLVTVGNIGANPDVRTSLVVQTDAVTPPLVPYAAYTSDSIDLYWAESASKMEMVSPCGIAAGTREANDVCVRRLPNGSVILNPNDFLVVANPRPAVANSCIYQVNATAVGVPSRISLTAGQLGNLAPAASSPCADPTQAFWNGGEVYAMKLGGASFRIDWTGPNNVPRLQYDPDGWWDARNGWVTVAENVERMKVRVGLMSRDLLNPNPVPPAAPLTPPPVLWFPDPLAIPTARPALDACLTTIGSCILTAIPGANSDPGFPDRLDAVDTQIATLLGGAATPEQVLRAQLMRRARIVELDLTVRSARQDLSLVRPLGPGYVIDGAGNPLDGRSRRHYEMRVSLRNYGYAGI